MKTLKLFLLLLKRNSRWLWLKYIRRRKKLIKAVHGYELELNLEAVGFDVFEKNIYKQLALDGGREFAATAMVEKYVKPGEVIFELGANIGYYALLETQLMQQRGTIYAAEPEPHNFASLQQNIARNHVGDMITPYQLAVTDRVGQFPLYVSTNSNTHSLIKPTHGVKEIIIVRTTTIDEFLKDKKPITFLRMDIEGFETKVFDGAQHLLNAKRPLKMFVELHPNRVGGAAIIALLQLLKRFGFQTDYVIARDTALRRAVGQTLSKRMSIDELMAESNLRDGAHAYEVFFTRGVNAYQR